MIHRLGVTFGTSGRQRQAQFWRASTESIWRAVGWAVVIVWEHDNPEGAATQITALVAQRTSR
jgi:hypothetical protein